MPIKNIIFDLGGVIIDIDYNLTLDEFRKLGATNIDTVYTQSKQDSLFDCFDIGKITEAEFRTKLNTKLNITANDIDFDKAWNAMLLDIPLERLEFIKSLRKNYNVFLFSNTNDIHLREVFNICQSQTGFRNFDEFFDKQYYSNILGNRKPNKDAFITILSENGFNADETLFIDDSIQHVLGAREAGIHAVHLTKDKSIFDVLFFIEDIHRLNETPNRFAHAI